jgi:gas vesicle protein
MADEKNGLAKGLFIGFIAGGIVGAIAALLYAPKSGKELRGDIKRKAGDLAEDASEYVKKARARTAEIINEGKNRSEQLVSDAKETSEQILGSAEKVLTGIRERAGEESGRVKSALRAGVDAYKTERDRTRDSAG